MENIHMEIPCFSKNIFISYMIHIIKIFNYELVGSRRDCGKTRRRPLARPRHRWENNIKTNITETGWGYKLGSSGSGQRPVADN
jgi:hypothetical protein